MPWKPIIAKMTFYMKIDFLREIIAILEIYIEKSPEKM